MEWNYRRDCVCSSACPVTDSFLLQVLVDGLHDAPRGLLGEMLGLDAIEEWSLVRGYLWVKDRFDARRVEYEVLCCASFCDGVFGTADILGSAFLCELEGAAVICQLVAVMDCAKHRIWRTVTHQL